MTESTPTPASQWLAIRDGSLAAMTIHEALALLNHAAPVMVAAIEFAAAERDPGLAQPWKATDRRAAYNIARRRLTAASDALCAAAREVARSESA